MSDNEGCYRVSLLDLGGRARTEPVFYRPKSSQTQFCDADPHTRVADPRENRHVKKPCEQFISNECNSKYANYFQLTVTY